MATRRRDYLQASEPNAPIPLTRGIGWGLLGGLAGTLSMDLVLMGALPAFGMPALTCFSIVGDTVARLLSVLGLEIAGGAPLGAAAHYLIGPVIGALFGASVTQIEALRVDNPKKGIVLAILYVELLSQPILAMSSFLLNMTASETFQWFSGAFMMHWLCGIILGATVAHGLRPAATGRLTYGEQAG